MNNCQYCHDQIEEWNALEKGESVCHFCTYDIDDDDKLIAKMIHNDDIGSPDKFLANKYQNYLNG